MIFKNTSLLNDCKPTREFLTMEQKRAGYCAISKLKVLKEDKNTGEKINIEVTEPQEIREEMRGFYQNIFAKQQIIEGPSAIENFLNSDDDYRPLLEFKKKTLSNSQRDSLEGEISLHELTTSLFEDMKGTSAPGIDGFTVNFIRKFWPPLSHVVKNAINKSKSKGELTSTMRFAIFKLLRKGEKDPTLAANFRPISLLSVIYKLASCVIKKRLKKVIPQIIGKQQKAYIESDNMGAVLLNLLSSMKNYNEKKLASLILCIDFWKAAGV